MNLSQIRTQQCESTALQLAPAASELTQPNVESLPQTPPSSIQPPELEFSCFHSLTTAAYYLEPSSAGLASFPQAPCDPWPPHCCFPSQPCPHGRHLRHAFIPSTPSEKTQRERETRAPLGPLLPQTENPDLVQFRVEPPSLQ